MAHLVVGLKPLNCMSALINACRIRHQLVNRINAPIVGCPESPMSEVRQQGQKACAARRRGQMMDRASHSTRTERVGRSLRLSLRSSEVDFVAMAKVSAECRQRRLPFLPNVDVPIPVASSPA